MTYLENIYLSYKGIMISKLITKDIELLSDSVKVKVSFSQENV